MKKLEFIQQISELSGLSKEDSQKAVITITDVISEALKKGESVQLLGFGNFSVVERSQRKCIDPQTRNEMIKTKKKVAKWKPSKTVLD